MFCHAPLTLNFPAGKRVTGPLSSLTNACVSTVTGWGHLPSASEFLRQGHLGSGVTDQPLGPSAGLAGVCGCDLLLATINHGNDPLTTPLTEGMLQHHFSAFWLDQQESALL